MSFKQIENHIFKNELTKLFNVRVVVDPYTRKASGLPTLGAARSKVIEFKAELTDLRSKRSKGIVTFAEAVEKFLQHRSSRYAPSGIYSLKTTLATYSGDLSKRLITDIKREDMELFGNQLMTTLQPSTVDRIIRHFRAVFVYLVELGHLDRDPSLGIKFSRTKYDRELSAMSRSEMIKLLAYTEETNHPLHFHFKVAYLTGARSGELKELRCKDYNKELGHVVISRSLCDKTKTVSTTKNGRSRVVPLSEQGRKLFNDLVKDKKPEDHLLPRVSQFMRGEASSELKQVQRSLNIPETNFHSIRASFITHLLLSGQNIATVQKIVGHSDPKTTDAYIRLCGLDILGSTNALDFETPFESIADKEYSDIMTAIKDL